MDAGWPSRVSGRNVVRVVHICVQTAGSGYLHKFTCVREHFPAIRLLRSGRLGLGFSTLSWNTFLYRGPIQNRAENTRGPRQRIEEHKVRIENLKRVNRITGGSSEYPRTNLEGRVNRPVGVQGSNPKAALSAFIT